MIRILLVEDHPEYLETLATLLKQKGYEVDAVLDPIQGIEYAATNFYDLIISDLHMKSMNGFRFFKTVHTIAPQAITIILTALPTDDAELQSFDFNVDYFLSKDKSSAVLLKYIEHALENKERISRNRLESKKEQIMINLESREVLKANTTIKLAPKEYAILILLMSNKNRVVTRDEILETIWEDEIFDVDERVIDVHIRRLRKKLKLNSIISIRSQGYKWNE